MNKNRMILAIAGGVIGVAVLATAYLAWSAMAAKTAAIEGDDEEGTPGLDSVIAKAQSLSHQEIYACVASVQMIESNAQHVAAWQDEALKTVSRGDKMFNPTTSAAFKTFLVSDAKRLAMLPGSVNGALAAENFTFGPFREYIVEGKMPAEAQLTQLQRQWDDIASVVELLAEAGIARLTDIQLKVREAPVEEAPKKVRKPNKKASKKKAEAESDKAPIANTYVFAFTTRPAAFVKAINLLGTGERFIVVEDFALQHPNDALSTILGGESKQQENARSGRRRGRRGVAVEQKPAEEDVLKNGIVTDPLLDAPCAVSMTLTVYDFRSLEDANKGEEVKE